MALLSDWGVFEDVGNRVVDDVRNVMVGELVDGITTRAGDGDYACLTQRLQMLR